MKTITLSILASEEDAVMQQLHEWQQRHAVRIEAADPLLFAGEPLTAEEWVQELAKAEASGFVSGEEARRRFGL